MQIKEFIVWPAEERLIVIRIRSEELTEDVSNRPGSVAFETLDDGREGLVSIRVLLLSEFQLGEDAVWAAQVPFVVPAGETVFIGALLNEEDQRFDIPVGGYALYYETGFLKPPAPSYYESEDAEDEAAEEDEAADEEPTMWCRLTFVPQSDVEPAILRANPDFVQASV